MQTPPPPETGQSLLDIEAVQRAVNRSRASIYRYANTDLHELNPDFDPRKLNPEHRLDKKDPLLFHPNEVARFARDVLKIRQVTVELLSAPHTATQELLGEILVELRKIRAYLEIRT
jgi:hypothetical protein